MAGLVWMAVSAGVLTRIGQALLFVNDVLRHVRHARWVYGLYRSGSLPLLLLSLFGLGLVIWLAMKIIRHFARSGGAD